MKLKLTINRHTTPSELIHLSGFLGALGLNRGGAVVSETPIDPADLNEGEEVVTVRVPPAAGEEPVKRRRRTKAEIEAAQANCTPDTTVETTEPVGNEPEQAPAAETPAPTPAATEAATTAPAEPATESPSEPAPAGKEYTEAEVQDLAGKVARSVGPEVVKGKIAELGASRIAELTQPQRNELGAFLVSKLP